MTRGKRICQGGKQSIRGNRTAPKNSSYLIGNASARGRATTRGRGNRNVSGRGRNVARVQKPNRSELNQMPENKLANLDINTNAIEFFTQNASFEQHFEAQNSNRIRYIATIMAMDNFSIDIVPNAKARSLAAAFARHDSDLAKFLLNYKKQIGFVDVLKSISILDSGREKRAIEKKLARIAKSGSVMRPKRLGLLKRDIDNLSQIIPKQGSCSGALARHLRSWVRTFSEKELEFFALHLPAEPWRKLANIVHLNPEKDFPNATWFLSYCFGAEAPKDSLVDRCRLINEQNVNELVATFDLPYAYLKKFKASLNEHSKKRIAENQDLNTLIWWYEDLTCTAVDDIIRQRLERGDKLTLAYGKIMERLLMFKDLKDKANKANAASFNSIDNSLFSLIIPLAEMKLKSFKSTLAAPVAVIGDASSSMSVAIRTATIISSLLAAISSAKLTFFNHQNFVGNMNPTNLSDVLTLAYTTKASGSTAPAVSLVPYYDQREIVKTFIIVTDEEENTDGMTNDNKRWRFFDLFMEYRKSVYPASLIFVSFLSSQHSEGQMYRQFVRDNVPDVVQFKFDRSRPDLTKLDSILGLLCSKSSESFNGIVEKMESELNSLGLMVAFEKLKMESAANSDLTNSENKPIVY